jgi:pimeloyl-ACP methyl ester carboxylesterase
MDEAIGMALRKLGGHHINVATYGDFDSRRSPIVLLHEGLGSVSAWGPFPEVLACATRRTVVAYDRRGYGRSCRWPGPWPATFLQDEAKQVLSPLLQWIGHPSPILVGHSDGGSIALAYTAHREPAAPLPLGIVSIAAHVFVEDISIESVHRLKRMAPELMPRLDRHHDYAQELLESWTEVWPSERMKRWNLDEELQEIACDVMAFQGADDRYGTSEQLDRIASQVSGSVDAFELAGVDHWPHREAEEQVIRLIRQFCEKVGGG